MLRIVRVEARATKSSLDVLFAAGFCEFEICMCDLVAADCFARYEYPGDKPKCEAHSGIRRVLNTALDWIG